MKWKPYSDYRPSGIEWLGEVPGHWGTKKLKYVCTCNNDVLSESTLPGYQIRYVDISSVSAEKGIEKIEEYTFADAPSRARRCVRNGDTILSTVRTYLKAIARIERPDDNLIVSTGFAVIRPGSEMDSRFVSYLLRSEGFVGEIVANSVGVSYPAINASQVMGLAGTILPIAEQRAIADFLDRETSKIDTLIQKKERQIELLREKRSALITRAVTKGLDPNVKMKDSGVEWLGEVPGHWGIKRLKTICTFVYGESLADENRIEGNFPVYGSNGIVGYHSKAITHKPCVIIGRKGSFGKVNFSEKECFPIDTTYFIDDRFAKCDLKWLNYILPILGLDSFSKDTGVPGLNREDAHNKAVPVPDLQEQKSIADFLDRETARIDTLTEKISTSIEKLREYRGALISAAVTGKIDVRGCCNAE